ncbi:tripartite tricarboxylate transporter permease [Pararhodobacter zhoushanensis]|uniref:tripartite tricarboxylate transporter permease n=1 Tax=Pararhodobacter zhoushanensis TaxID=2479545 RepID=UPI0013E0E17A|nr:tripartite tricarboxylate transporter permease [Pararhodobacter zhoushanensis]
MIDSILAGFALIAQWPTPLYLVAGVLIGIWLGAVPGLGGVTGLVLVLPFTFSMEPAPAFALMLGMFAPITTADTLSSVLLGTPGTAGSQATVLDGYPLAKKGQAERALGAAYTVSAFGGVFGALMLLLFLPIAMPLIMLLGTPDFFLLALLGLLMVGSVSGPSLAKGMGAAAIGLLMSQVGFPVSSPAPRYWFGEISLMDGLPLVPVVLGLFGVAEMLRLSLRDSSISAVPREQAEGGRLIDGIRDAFHHRWLAFRCAMLGTYLGMLPGIGNAVADWIAYGHAVQSAKDKSQFGKGDIRGVIAPESTNNAVIGAALIPTLTLGIPGTGAMAILLGAMLIHGLTPGRMMLTEHLDLTISMIWTIVIANVLAAGLLMIWGRQFARAAFISGHYIVPAVLMFLFMGAWLFAADLSSWYLLLAFGVLGWLMGEAGWPRPPLVLGFVLGKIMEQSAILALQSYALADFMTRPQTLILIACVVLFLGYSAWSALRTAKALGDNPAQEGAVRNAWLSVGFGLAMLAIFGWALSEALDWTLFARTMPMIITISGIAIFLFTITTDFRRGLRAAQGPLIEAPMKTVVFFGLLLAMVLGAWWVGQMVAMTAFVLIYLLVVGRVRPLWGVALYSLGVFCVLYGLYAEVLNVRFLRAHLW